MERMPEFIHLILNAVLPALNASLNAMIWTC